MELEIIAFLISVAITTVSSQVQNVRIPPGALVEFEFEFINQKPGQPRSQAAGSGGAQGMMVPPGQMMSMGGAGSMMGGGQMMGMAGQPMGGAGQMMGGAGQMMGMAGQSMGGAGQMTGGASQMMGAPPMMPQIPPGPPGSPVQQLLSNMAKMALALRRMYGVRQPLPPMEEPCPCDADCCQRPADPRRILPVLFIPMTQHQGCCGCVECPASLSPVINGMIEAAKMAASRQPPVDL